VGRLFWKFFFFTMLAQIIATISVGGTFWLKETESRKRIEQIDLSPPASVQVDSAALTLQYGGVSALRNLLMKMDHRHQVLAVDDSNHELLGRPVNAQTLLEAHAMLGENMQRREIQQASAQNGEHFLLFSLTMPPGDGNFDTPGSHSGPPPNGPTHGGPGGPMQPFQPFLGVATAILASLIFAWLLARYFSKPIQSLRLAFEAIASGNLNARLGSEMGQRSDELADLGRDFDAMADRLRSLVEGQRRMLHEVSHELRSPLARLQVAIGLARQQPEKIGASLTRIERESARMEKLVGELLTLSRLDALGHPLDLDVIDFGELVVSVVDDARFEAEANGRTLELAGNCWICIKGDLELLHRAIENVVRNALKHTAPGSAVIVEAQLNLGRDEIHLSVLDRGPGVPVDELQLIFEPFFRGASTVRNLDGHGLGLAIANRVVGIHGGRILATNREGGGLCVEISLPIKT
jgi:two-component system OmpR family sensor kinase